MAQKKLDYIVEAVRYSAEGNIAYMRVYERHGAVWSDHLLLDRKEVSERLAQGKRFVAGERKNYLGGVFNTGKALYQIDGKILIEEQTCSHDLLSGVPVF
jgi:hypothetical protein